MKYVTIDQLAAVAARWTPPPPPPPPSPPPPARSSSDSDLPLDQRMRNYLAKCPAAISGAHGHDTAITQLGKFLRGFDLTPDAALPFAQEWNTKCDPPWSDHDLYRKLTEASKKPGPRGWLLRPPSGTRNSHHNGTSSSDGPATARLCNYTWDERQDGETMRRYKRGLLADEVFRSIQDYTGGWPCMTGGILFAHGKDGKLQWLENANELFAWLNWQYGLDGGKGVDWIESSDCATRSQFFSFCRQHSTMYKQIQLFPHYPPLPNTYYLHPEPTGGDGAALRDLMRMFCPASTIDEDLILAFLLTIFWGGPAGKRPAFCFQASETAKQAGRGAGKSTIPEFVARMIGGHIGIGASEKEEEMHRRLLSSSGRSKQLAIIDNIKTLRFSSSTVERLITSPEISGRQMFVGEGERPNYITWVLTFNEPSMSKDMAQRSVVIEVNTPEYTTTWVRAIETFIDARKWDVIGDLIAILKAPKPLPEGVPVTRWGVWEGEVLSLLPDPAKAQKVIMKRRKAVDDDESLHADALELLHAAIIREFSPYIGTPTPDTMKVFIPSAVLADLVVKQLHPKYANDVRNAVKWFLMLKVPGTSKCNAKKPYRGIMWSGPNADKDEKVEKWRSYINVNNLDDNSNAPVNAPSDEADEDNK